MVLLVLKINSGFPGPPEPSLKGRLHHSAATAKAASPGPSERQLSVCARASLEPPLFPAFSQVRAAPAAASPPCGRVHGLELVRRRRAPYSPSLPFSRGGTGQRGEPQETEQ